MYIYIYIPLKTISQTQRMYYQNVELTMMCRKMCPQNILVPGLETLGPQDSVQFRDGLWFLADITILTGLYTNLGLGCAILWTIGSYKYNKICNLITW